MQSKFDQFVQKVVLSDNIDLWIMAICFAIAITIITNFYHDNYHVCLHMCNYDFEFFLKASLSLTVTTAFHDM